MLALTHQQTPAHEDSSLVSHTLEYMHATPGELATAREVVNQAEKSKVVRACRDMLREAGDTATINHSGRVALAGAIIGERAGLEARDILLVAEAAECHDIGRIDPQIRKLTESPVRFKGAERQRAMHTIKRHAELGAQIVRAHSDQEPESTAIAEIVGGHHAFSKVDSYGPFPHFTAGLARFVAIGDELDALASQRAYKPAMTESETRQTLENQLNVDRDLLELCFDRHPKQ